MICVTFRASRLTALVLLFIAGPSAGWTDDFVTKTETFRGKIVFFGNKFDGYSSVETMTADGSELQTVLELEKTDESRFILNGRIAPDGRSLAFVVTKSDMITSELRILSTESQQKILVDKAQFIAGWSPDGRRIAVWHGESGNRQNLIVDVTSGEIETTSVPLTDTFEDWAPNRASLSVIAGNAEKSIDVFPLRTLYLATPAGELLAHLTTDARSDSIWSRFSPDGRQISYHQIRHGDDKRTSFAVVANSDGSNARNVVCFSNLDEGFVTQAHGEPCWSPDSKTVVWKIMKWPVGATPEENYDQNTFELVFVAADGSSIRRLPLTAETFVNQQRQWFGFIDWR